MCQAVDYYGAAEALHAGKLYEHVQEDMKVQKNHHVIPSPVNIVMNVKIFLQIKKKIGFLDCTNCPKMNKKHL
ncbi:hypothetical protein PR048_004972 [Dryococelus australis]|uniref:Uncharacterized protein n=1 Tax=Dryococelus australis TaxID=614101 RepID=A0ABQ9I6X4_9NEOP|nr:hypothetical protein PR048_004972 [Dryococelus australis]